MESIEPLISVVMPSFNHEKYISKTIDSVLEQDYSNIELIIIDDGSTDSSRSIIEKYQSLDSRIIAIFHESNRGIAKTLTDGLEHTNGTYISLIGSDDIWYKSKLTKELELVTSNIKNIVWSEGDIIDSNGQDLGIDFVSDLHHARWKNKNGQILGDLLTGPYVFGQSLLFHRDLMDGLRFNDNYRFLNDYLFFLDLFARGNSIYIEEPTAAYRIHGKNSILSDQKQWLREGVKVSEYLIDQYSSVMSPRARSVWTLTFVKNSILLGNYHAALAYTKSKMNTIFSIASFKVVMDSLLKDRRPLRIVGNLKIVQK